MIVDRLGLDGWYGRSRIADDMIRLACLSVYRKETAGVSWELRGRVHRTHGPIGFGGIFIKGVGVLGVACGCPHENISKYIILSFAMEVCSGSADEFGVLRLEDVVPSKVLQDNFDEFAAVSVNLLG